MSGGERRGMFKGTGQRTKFTWSTKVLPCPQARRYISSPLRLLGILFFLFSINTQCRKQVVMSFWFVFKQTNDELAFSVTGTGIRRPHTAITSVSIVVSFYFTFFLFSFLHLGFKPAMMCVCSGLTLAPCDLNPRPGISSSSC